MGLLQASRQNTGGGGGGLTIEGFQTDQFEQTTNFTSGSVTLALTQTPVDPGGIDLDYNGQTYYQNISWSYDSGTNEITILFADPYVTEYPESNYFQVIYPY